jgi:hypothetical protein
MAVAGGSLSPSAVGSRWARRRDRDSKGPSRCGLGLPPPPPPCAGGLLPPPACHGEARCLGELWDAAPPIHPARPGPLGGPDTRARRRRCVEPEPWSCAGAGVTRRDCEWGRCFNRSCLGERGCSAAAVSGAADVSTEQGCFKFRGKLLAYEPGRAADGLLARRVAGARAALLMLAGAGRHPSLPGLSESSNLKTKLRRHPSHPGPGQRPAGRESRHGAGGEEGGPLLRPLLPTPIHPAPPPAVPQPPGHLPLGQAAAAAGRSIRPSPLHPGQQCRACRALAQAVPQPCNPFGPGPQGRPGSSCEQCMRLGSTRRPTR